MNNPKSIPARHEIFSNILHAAVALPMGLLMLGFTLRLLNAIV